jgi:hypothetical protein
MGDVPPGGGASDGKETATEAGENRKRSLFDGRRRRSSSTSSAVDDDRETLLETLPRQLPCLDLVSLLTCSRRPAPRLAMATERERRGKASRGGY